jgi:hypothetical protein
MRLANQQTSATPPPLLAESKQGAEKILVLDDGRMKARLEDVAERPALRCVVRVAA